MGSSNSKWIMIGIRKVEKDKSPPIEASFVGDGYGYCTSNGTKSGLGFLVEMYGIRCVAGDIVKMILDFDNLSLSFNVNGIDYGKSHIITQGKYRAAVYMYCSGDEIQLLE